MDLVQGMSRYRLLSKLTSGGMGDIFLARRQGASLGPQVVIKRIRPIYASDPELAALFVQEARIGAMLDHPNIVQVHELGRQERFHFIVMEHVKGLSLADALRLAGGPLPIDFALQIAAEAAEGLRYVHERRDAQGRALNLVHRDISPGNILVSTAGSVKITDFGIAKCRWSLAVTQVGMVRGKLGYLTPEQAIGLPVDRRTDIYGLGLVLYEITTGQPAHRGDSPTALMDTARQAAVLPPEHWVAGYPPDLARVLDCMLAREPAERYASCDEVIEVLHRLLAARDVVPSAAALGRYVERLTGEIPGDDRGESDVDLGETVFTAIPTVKTPGDALQRAAKSLPRAEVQLPAPTPPVPAQRRSRWQRWSRWSGWSRNPRWAVGVGVAVAFVTLVALVALGPSRLDDSAHAAVAPVAVTPAAPEASSVPAVAPPTTSPSIPAPGATSHERVRLVRPPPESAERAAIDLTPRSRPTPPSPKSVGASEPPATPQRGLFRSRVTVRKVPKRAVSKRRGAAPGPRSPPAGPAVISFRLPPGQHVQLDGRVLGASPLPPATVSPGPHVVIVTNPVGYRSRRHRVVAKPGKTLIISE